MQSIGLYVNRTRPLEWRAQWATRVNKPCIHLAYIARPSVSSSYFVLIHSSHSSPLYIWNGLRDIHFSWVYIRSFPSSKMAFLFFQWFSENPWIILIHSKKDVILLVLSSSSSPFPNDANKKRQNESLGIRKLFFFREKKNKKQTVFFLYSCPAMLHNCTADPISQFRRVCLHKIIILGRYIYTLSNFPSLFFFKWTLRCVIPLYTCQTSSWLL